MDLTTYALEQFKSIGGFIKNNNYNIVEVREDYCKLEGTITETSLNNLNMAHGGYLFGLADTAGGIAAMTGGRGVVTINSSISYVKPARGSKLTAIAKPLQKGNTIATFEIEILDDENDLVSKATITYRYIK